MNLSRLRLRLTLGYLGIFATILILLIAVAVFGFYLELTRQEDELLTQEARNQAANLVGEERREVLSDGSADFSWVSLTSDGAVIDSDAIADSLGLPDPELAREAVEEDAIASATIQGEEGLVRAVSVPVYESGELVGVVQYARSLQGVRQAVSGLAFILLPLGLGALGLAAIGGQFMAGRAVGPVQTSFERQRAFVADASHELKTPLTLIRADTEVLQRGITDPEDRELADDILAETDRMSTVLSNLLFVARLDAGKVSVEREAFELSEAASEMVDRFSARASSAGVHLKASVPGKLQVLGDRERTEQILSVLVDNALRHTPRGGSVTIAGCSKGDLVEARVEDSGPGIAQEHLPHLFDRFYRVDKARSREAGGAGLGLAIAWDLAQVQEGTLKAENLAEGGAVFRFTLLAS